MKLLRHISAVLFLCSIMTFPRSFVWLKLTCLGIFLLVHVVGYRWRGGYQLHPRILIFYSCVAIGGLTWSLVGMAGAGEPQGIYETLRLYVGWSMAYTVILTLLRSEDGLQYLHSAIVISGLLIFTINGVGLLDQIVGLELLPQEVYKELVLNIGFHLGYVQLTSHNIGSLLFIAPYLIASQCCKSMQGLNGKLTKLSFVASILMSILSGRRALWLCILLTPLVIGAIAILSGSWREIKPSARKLIVVLACGTLVAATYLVTARVQPGETGIVTLDYVVSAFSAEDQRTIQSGYLISGFTDQPLLGSGFGAYAGYLRNAFRPWLYELTYVQLLFNSGLAGVLYWTALAGIYFLLAFQVIRANRGHSGQPLCLIAGVCGFLMGAYSNPYLASFDFLIFVAMLPFVASLPHAIRRAPEVRGVSVKDSIDSFRAQSRPKPSTTRGVSTPASVKETADFVP